MQQIIATDRTPSVFTNPISECQHYATCHAWHCAIRPNYKHSYHRPSHDICQYLEMVAAGRWVKNDRLYHNAVAMWADRQLLPAGLVEELLRRVEKQKSCSPRRALPRRKPADPHKAAKTMARIRDLFGQLKAELPLSQFH